ncbi:MAG: sigma-70 family RNA polymerase sigma factor [Microbacteriaceae bacterium]
MGVLELADLESAGLESADTEARLWASVLDGGTAGGRGFARLFDLHGDRVFRHCLRLMETRQDAEDCVAVVFLECWRSRRRVRLAGGSVLPWLLATATNVCRNAGRSRARYRRFLQSLPRERDAHDSGENDLVDPRLVRDVARALRALPSSDGRLIGLVAFEGYSVADAAEVLGITPGNARTRLSRARGRLRAEVAPETMAILEEL